MYQRRCTIAQERMAHAGMDYLFVAPSSDFQYFVGFQGHITERLMLLILPRAGQPVLVLPSFEARRFEPLATFFSLKTWQETDDPYQAVKQILGDAVSRPLRIGISDRERAVVLLGLQKNVPAAAFVSASEVIAPLRITKDEAEIELLRAVNRFTDEAFDEFLTMPMAGLTERHLLRRLGDLMLTHSLDSVAFANPYSGPHSASPHHVPTDRVVHQGDVVFFDFGGRYKGYYSDTTRTVAVGGMPEEFEKVYNVVRSAQQEAVDAIKPGVPIGNVDIAARNYITKAGYGQYFTHRVGHGLGLDEHEPPYLTSDNRAPLQAGMVFSVEPGIYLPGRFGVRIEDTFLVTETGGQRLSECSREIQIVS